MEKKIVYQGQIFGSIKEFTTKYNLPYQQTVNKLNNGYTLEQIVKGEKKPNPQPNLWNIAVSYKGHEYSSLRQFCQVHNLKYSRIYALQKQGLTMEEIIDREGIVLNFPENQVPNPKMQNGEFIISEMTPGIKNVYENNPYCILGIPCNSTKATALERRDKLEKLGRLGAVATYRSSYDLQRVEKPNRDLGHIQIVLNNLDKMEYRWMWYLKDDYAELWDDESLFGSCNPTSFEYDEFLACYYNVLISDPAFSDLERWNIIFKMLDWFFHETDADVYKVLSTRICDSEKVKYNYHMVVNNFKENIKSPLLTNIEEADGDTLLSLIIVLEKCEGTIKEELVGKINTLAMRWVDRSLDELKTSMQRIRSVKDLNSSTVGEANVIYECLDKLSKREFGMAQRLASKLDGLYSEMIMDRFKSQFYDATIVLIAGGRKKDACRFDSMVYIYCTDKQKQEIKRVYPNEWLEIPDSEFTVAECRIIAGRFESSQDWKNGFKWMMKAAMKGDAASQNDIGVYYALGRGRTADGNEAVKWYEKAASGGNAVAWGNLAVRYNAGLVPFAKNPEKAKECWIKAFKIDRNGGYDKKLDENFPGWKHIAHPLLTFSESDWRYKIKPFAEEGIADAQYWYGVLLYKGIHGCTEDKNAARRWMLKAAVYDHPLAIRDLKVYYGINAVEATTAKEMFDLGYSFYTKSGDQNQDLRFYWYYKAVINGYKSGYNNLGVCYDVAAGVERDYKKANEYYLLAIEYENNSGALGNYARNLYLGNGVDKNLEKSKEYMLKAKAAGNSTAEEFLRDKFGIQDSVFDFSSFNDTVIYSANGLRIEFCGIKDIDGKIQFKFWVHNTSENQRNIWMYNTVLDGNDIGNFKKIGEYEARTGSGFGIITLEGKLGTSESKIEFSIEVDDSDDKKIFSTRRVKLTALMHIKVLQFSLIDGTGNEPTTIVPPTDEDDGEEDEIVENNYDFAGDDFEDVTVYNNDGMQVDFGGLVVGADKKVYLKIWSKNTSNKVYKIWLKDIVIDGERVSEYEEAATCTPNGSWASNNVLAENVDVDTYYDIEFTAEINDENNHALALAKRVKLHVDFLQEEFRVTLSDHVDFDEDAGDDEEDESSEDNYDFADEDFTDVMVYDNGGIRVEFGGLEVENDETVYLKIWSKNTSNRIYKIWLKDIVVDEERVSEYKEAATCMPNGLWERNKVLAENVDVDTYYDIEFTAEINDENNQALALAKRVKLHVDFPDKEIRYTLADHIDFDDNEEDDEDEDKDGIEEVDTDDPVYVENSFCMRNYEHDGLEIYFPYIPSDFVRTTMKEQGWRWHSQKGCWYAKENSERIALAKRITGEDVKG